MNVTIEIPEERAARFQKQAEAKGLTLARWFLDLAEQNTPVTPSLTREAPRLCRGGSSSLTFPGVHREPCVSRQAHELGEPDGSPEEPIPS